MSEDEPLLTQPHYYWGCCMVCRVRGTSQRPLKRCSRCSSIYYCSIEHQKLHWKVHKEICKFISTHVDNNVEESSELEIRTTQISRCEVELERPLREWEKEMFWFSKRCRVCDRRNAVFDCLDCRSVSYCSIQHRDQYSSIHTSLMCKELGFAMRCDNFESTISVGVPPIPSEIDESFSLTSIIHNDIYSYLKSSSIINDDDEEEDKELRYDRDMQFRFLTDRLSRSLTILYAACTSGLSSGKVENASSLLLHLVGSNIMELLGIIKYEYILHRLPSCKTLTIVFIGPELEEEVDNEIWARSCRDCKDRNRRMRYKIRKETYSHYCESSHYRIPDMIAAFNCGFHEFEGQKRDTWKESLPYLIRHVGVPLVFTSYTRSEAEKDMRLIKATAEEETTISLEILLSAIPNPYRSHRPIRDPECDQDFDVFYNNQFMSLVRSKVK